MKSLILTLVVVLLATLTAGAQENKKSDVPNNEIAFTYLPMYGTVDKLWYQSIGLEWAYGVSHGLGFVANYSYARKSFSANGINVPAYSIEGNIYTFGGRYTYRTNKTAAFGEVLFGGFRSGEVGHAQSVTNKLAIQLGGGFDYSLSRNFALRMPQVEYTAVSSSNSQTDNLIQIGGGVVWSF
ncbi:MAG: hypothetical protein FWD64_03690 [Acidobacteriaceae bacterium]|nr:hypothetical protein [Acidobacteriaceae bacterium]